MNKTGSDITISLWSLFEQFFEKINIVLLSLGEVPVLLLKLLNDVTCGIASSTVLL